MIGYGSLGRGNKMVAPFRFRQITAPLSRQSRIVAASLRME